MLELCYDVAIIGAGPAGLSAAVSARENGAQRVIIVERDSEAGGVLQQCIHPGFGLSYFNEELTGPEYAGRFYKKAQNIGVEFLYNNMVLELCDDGLVCAGKNGMTKIFAKSLILAMGCRERTRGSIQLCGTRPAGVYTAGAAQHLVNRQNKMVGKEVVILGSGDIGMIMARRMTLEGAKVLMVVEIMDYLSGLTRNRVQCLDDFGIELKLATTITRVVGNQRVEGVYIAKIDENKTPILETEEFIKCDTLLLSVGLIPENELSKKAAISVDGITAGPKVNQYMQTEKEHIFACGNVVHVNDLADNVSLESKQAGKYAALYSQNALEKSLKTVDCRAADLLRYVCPQKIAMGQSEEEITLYFRVAKPSKNVILKAMCGDKVLASKKVQRVSPGEMEHLTIKTTQIIGDKIEIAVEEAL